MTGALSEYRVVELGEGVAGAVLGMLLADQGAEVVKVEPPSGDPLRGHPVFSVWNRGKKSLVLDPASDRDARIGAEVVKSSDVLVECPSSRCPDAFTISYEEATSLNEGIVYLSLPGLGEGHPQEGLEAREEVLGAYTGIYTDRSPDGSTGPSFISLPYVSIFGAMVAAPAIATALFHRARTGRGQRVTVPLYDAMYTAIGSLLVRRLDVPAAPRALSPAIGRFYQCSDGRWVNVHADYERALRPLLEALGHPEWYSPLTDAGLRVDDVARGKWEAKFAERWMDRTALEWEEIMARAGVPCIMCRTVEEWMDTAHAQESGAVVTLADPVYGPMRQVGIQVRLSDTPGSVGGPSPALGQHTEAVISELQAP